MIIIQNKSLVLLQHPKVASILDTFLHFTHLCQGAFGMECVSISSNDMLQLGVLLPLSKTELLQDSV